MRMSKRGWGFITFIIVGLIILCSIDVNASPMILAISPIFGSIPIKKVKSNKFNMSHEKKLSLNMGDLVPVLCQEVLPGDKWRVNSDVFVRLAPMLAPIMHRVNLYVHYFYVPTRLLFDDWQEFITGGKTGTSQVVSPYITVGPSAQPSGQPPEWTAKGSLYDYLGLPLPPSIIYRSFNISVLPFRAYNLIWREYYRDQNLDTQGIEEFPTQSGQVTDQDEIADIMYIKKRCWEKDYFTSCLPTAQRGEQILIPMTTSAEPPMIGDGVFDATTGNTATGAVTANGGVLEVNGQDAFITPSNGATINDLRRAEKLQQWLEKAMRGGGRYKEFLYSFFNVNSSDARLQRPEYLGGGKQGIIISEVLANAYSVDADAKVIPQGNQSGHGISAGTGHGFQKYFEEHGYLLAIMSIIPRTAYQQGVHKMWQRTDKLDYAWPEFAHIGEQEVMRDELMMSWGDSDTNVLFGYQSRYAEMKFAMDTVHGDFRDNLSFWHMGRIFEELPELNESFVNANPTHRIFAVSDPGDHKLYAQVYHNARVIRKLPIFGTPSI